MNSRVFIDCVKCDVAYVGPGVGIVNTAVKFTVDGKSKWLTLSECEGCPQFYLTDDSIFEKLMDQEFNDEEFVEFMSSEYLDEFEGIHIGEYEEIEDAIEESENTTAATLLEYIIAVTRCGMEELDTYIEAGNGKYVDEIIIPGENGLDFLHMDQETIFRNRLFLETCIAHPHVYDAMDANVSRQMKKDLKMAETLSDEGYEEWKAKYINDKIIEFQDVKFLTVHYMFAGMGSYDEVIPEDMLSSFICWINGNGSAFMSEPRESTMEEIRIYISKNAIN